MVSEEGPSGAEAPGEVDAIGSQVDADHLAALQPDELGNELADKPKADDGDRVAQTDTRDAHGIQRDAAERREAGVLERHGVGYPHDQLAPCLHRLAVPGGLAAVGDAVAHVQIRDRRVPLHHDAGARVAEDGVLGELGAHLGGRAHRTRALHRIPHRAQVVGMASQLLEDTVLMDAGRLRAAADQRVLGPDQDVVR